jgi:hypothetical protein
MMRWPLFGHGISGSCVVHRFPGPDAAQILSESCSSRGRVFGFGLWRSLSVGHRR